MNELHGEVEQLIRQCGYDRTAAVTRVCDAHDLTEAQELELFDTWT